MKQGTKTKISVVIVEDDPGIREELLIALEKVHDIECLYAVDSAEKALEQIPLHPPHVVLMDIKLPGKSGIECVPELIEKVPSAEILMLTVYEDSEIIFQALKAGASGYLVKSSQPSALFSAIRDVASGGSPFSSSIARKVVRFFHTVQTPAQAPREMRDAEKLSPQEQTVLNLIASGFINKEIAEKLGVSVGTIKTYVERIYSKMHVHSRIEALNKLRS